MNFSCCSCDVMNVHKIKRAFSHFQGFFQRMFKVMSTLRTNGRAGCTWVEMTRWITELCCSLRETSHLFVPHYALHECIRTFTELKFPLSVPDLRQRRNRSTMEMKRKCAASTNTARIFPRHSNDEEERKRKSSLNVLVDDNKEEKLVWFPWEQHQTINMQLCRR